MCSPTAGSAKPPVTTFLGKLLEVNTGCQSGTVGPEQQARELASPHLDPLAGQGAQGRI